MVRLHPYIKPMNKYTLGIDVGAFGVKTGLLDLSTLKLKYIAMRKYESSALQPL
jgi:sugar (pentulose or hexulose) kinase